MTPLTPRAIALDFIRHELEGCLDADAIIRSHAGHVSPSVGDSPAIWLTVGGTLFPTRDGGQGIRLRKGQIGVALYYPDGRAEYGIFRLHDLADDILNPKPTQLELWPEQ